MRLSVFSVARSVALLAGFLGACSPSSNAPTPSQAQTTAGGSRAQPAPVGGRFATPRQRSLPEKPESLVAADLDGDGAIDLVAATLEPGALFIWMGARDGIPNEPIRVPIGGWPLAPVTFESQRFAERGRALAVASRATRELQVFSTWASDAKPALRVTLPATPRALDAGDLSHDGSIEFVAALDERRLCVCDAQGALQTVALPCDLPRVAHILADGSGVLIGAQDTASLFYFPAEGSRLGATPTFELALGGFPRAIAEADLDHDGDLELIVLGGDASAWIFGFGGADWRAKSGRAPLEWHTSAIPISLAVADFDGDGKSDLGVLSNAELSLEIWRDFAASGPRQRTTCYAGQSPTSIAAGDFDGDGHLDLAVANRDAGTLGVLRGDGRGGLETPLKATVANFPSSIVAADFDGDRRAGALVLSSKVTELSLVRYADGQLTRTASRAIGPAPHALVAGDFDGDRALDAAWIASDANGATLEFASGGAQHEFAAPLVDHALGRGADALLALDVDGDGKLDLVAADADGGALLVVLNSGGADPFAAAPIRLALAGAPVALARMDEPLARSSAERSVRIAVACRGPIERRGVAAVEILSGGARQLRVRELGFAALDRTPVALCSARLRERAARDLVVLVQEGSMGGALVPLVATESGDSWSASAGGRLSTGLFPRSVAAGHLAGSDRALDDLAVAAQNSHLVNLWRAIAGAAQPTFAREPDLGAGLGVIDLALGDADGDGRLDLFVADAFSNDVALILSR